MDTNMNSFSVEVREEEGGYLAFCPEMDLSARGETQESALLKLQSLIIFTATNSDDTDIDLSTFAEKGFDPDAVTLHIPANPSAH
jgi:predicted RNase H-like HicB family nuclease